MQPLDTRDLILSRLASGTATWSQLRHAVADKRKVSQSAFYYHLNKLILSESIEKRRTHDGYTVYALTEIGERVISVKLGPFEQKPNNQEELAKYKLALRKAFVILPFTEASNDAWKGGIKRACDDEGFVCLRLDKQSLSNLITESVSTLLESADAVIVDTTESNPNVMFELGWALAKEKELMIILHRDNLGRVPFDIKGARFFVYQSTWSGIEELYSEIRKFLKDIPKAIRVPKRIMKTQK